MDPQDEQNLKADRGALMAADGGTIIQNPKMARRIPLLQAKKRGQG